MSTKHGLQPLGMKGKPTLPSAPPGAFFSKDIPETGLGCLNHYHVEWPSGSQPRLKSRMWIVHGLAFILDSAGFLFRGLLKTILLVVLPSPGPFTDGECSTSTVVTFLEVRDNGWSTIEPEPKVGCVQRIPVIT